MIAQEQSWKKREERGEAWGGWVLYVMCGNHAATRKMFTRKLGTRGLKFSDGLEIWMGQIGNSIHRAHAEKEEWAFENTHEHSSLGDGQKKMSSRRRE